MGITLKSKLEESLYDCDTWEPLPKHILEKVLDISSYPKFAFQTDDIEQAIQMAVDSTLGCVFNLDDYTRGFLNPPSKEWVIAIFFKFEFFQFFEIYFQPQNYRFVHKTHCNSDISMEHSFIFYEGKYYDAATPWGTIDIDNLTPMRGLDCTSHEVDWESVIDSIMDEDINESLSG